MSDKTAQQRVLEVYPDYEAMRFNENVWLIGRPWSGVQEAVGRGDTEEAAWSDAASKLPKNVQEEQEKRPCTCEGEFSAYCGPECECWHHASPAPSVEIPPRPETDGCIAFHRTTANAHFDKLEGIILELQARAEKAEALCLQWNRSAGSVGICGSEYQDDPQRVFARILDNREAMMRTIHRNAEAKRAAESRVREA